MTMPFTNNTESKIVGEMLFLYKFFSFQNILQFQCQTKSEDLKISDCYSGGLGYLLQIDYERVTHKIAKPYPAFVPTIVYNSVSKFNNC